MQCEATAPNAPIALFASLYAELRRLARREVRRNGAYGVMSADTVLHEAWLDIQGRERLSFERPGQFLGYAARTMRGLVIDRLRAFRAKKRGGDVITSSLDEGEDVCIALAHQDTHFVMDALEHLERLEPDLAQLVDLRFFCGFTIGEIAQLQGISVRTAQRKWEKARELLQSALCD